MAQKVLIVDDSKSILTMMEFALKKGGYEVYKAYDGEEGLKKLDEVGGVDIIICDLNMPNMDGLAMLKKVKASAEYSKIPFLILTTEALESSREQAKKEGARAWIIKPFTEEQILGAVKKFAK